MRSIDRDGILLCELQARTFELSVDKVKASSFIFIRRFMHSKTVKLMDNQAILSSNLQPMDIIERMEEEYGTLDYGSQKCTHNEMYWMGYVYRYYSYTYDCSSLQAYKTIKPKELQGLFLPYHTMDPAQAIERILEAKGISQDPEMNLQYQYAVFRKIREEYAAKNGDPYYKTKREKNGDE